MSGASFDVLVLGGGSGGYACAIRAAELGAKVAIIEKDRVGGTCLHRGCIPTKALLHVAEVADAVRGANDLGIDAALTGFDPERMHAFRDGIVKKKYAGLQSLLSAHGITIIPGEGVLEKGPSVRVGDDVHHARHVVLATGGRTREIPGLDRGGRILTSDDAISLPYIPRRAIIVGGGVIGVEFASLWRSLGAEVTILEALPRLLAGEDETVSARLERALTRRGIRVVLGARTTDARQSDEDVELTLGDGSSVAADVALIAVGRVPMTDGIGLDEVGVTRADGFVVVDEHLRTEAAGISAVGDIVRGPQLAHRGFQQGIFVAERLAGGSPVPVPDETVPRITYSDPEVAAVGLTEAQAVARFGAERVQSYEYNLAGNGKSAILGTAGTVKVIRRTDGPVVGVHMVGARVGELIGQAQLIIGWEAHPEDIAPFVQAHPTQSEALGEAFLALAGRPLHAL
ncbi:dihydrolipoyl dehydrogenase [Microbacterium sp. LRZ72]|uniref:dihydrolipoyl dehydrogenase n=1 Tax=Microbacterium sp. LRZ72 TaxID=2942481 RepID=UPI0029AB21D8|nr:dihydrolipoyl dehydrogenase [Microbacterium sp. LRZ72]MDX2375329.1 dihydrolipoyl dehydrogenase [Microbacterium sp. LRZ72]